MGTEPIECCLIITYADGSHDEFRFPPQADEHRMAGFMEKLLGSSILCLQLEDRLVAIPANNIRSVELLPAPDQLPELVILHAKRATPLV